MTSEERGPWCSACGWMGTPWSDSLFPTRKVGRCLRGHNGASEHVNALGKSGRLVCSCGAFASAGCGRVILTTSRDEAEAIYTARLRRLATSRHHDHVARGKPTPLCDRCQAGDQLTL